VRARAPSTAGTSRTDGRVALPPDRERGLAILHSFTSGRSLLGVSELSRDVGLTRSTAHRYIATLARLGYLQQLRRGLGGFGNFAVSFSVIIVTKGRPEPLREALESSAIVRNARSKMRGSGFRTRVSIDVTKASTRPSNP